MRWLAGSGVWRWGRGFAHTLLSSCGLWLVACDSAAPEFRARFERAYGSIEAQAESRREQVERELQGSRTELSYPPSERPVQAPGDAGSYARPLRR